MSGEHTHPEMGALDTELARLTAQGVGTPGVVEVDSFGGATDDDKVAAGLAYVAAQTNKPTLRFRHGVTNLTRSITMFTGAKFLGAGGGVSVEQPRGGAPYASLIKFRGTDPTRPLFSYPAGQTFGTFIGHLAIEGTASSTIINSASSSAVAWRAVFRDLGMANMAHAIGTPAQKWLNTACTLDGDWNINNVRGAAGIHVGGSDSWFWVAGSCLLDSPTSLNAGVASLLHLDYQEKTTVGGLYLTCEGPPVGIRISGNDNTDSLRLYGIRVEGRNAGQPANGSAIRVEGGSVTIRDTWLAYAKGPALTVTGGRVLLAAPEWAPSTAVPAPMALVSGGELRVNDARGPRGTLPLVTRTGGTLTHDGTIRTA